MNVLAVTDFRYCRCRNRNNIMPILGYTNMIAFDIQLYSGARDASAPGGTRDARGNQQAISARFAAEENAEGVSTTLRKSQDPPLRLAPLGHGRSRIALGDAAWCLPPFNSESCSLGLSILCANV